MYPPNRSATLGGTVLRRPSLALALAISTTALALTACSGSSGGDQSTVTTGGTNAAAIAKLPANLQKGGTIKVASDAEYAPNEFLGADNKTVEGMDVDLGKAIGKELGLDFQFTNVAFDSIIPALGNRYDLGISSFTDNKKREQVVDMVDYFSAGTSFMVKKGSSLNPSTVADLCGKNVAVEKGTTQLDDVTAQKKKCSMGLLAFPGQNEANLALSSGRADVVLADSPVNAYAAKQSNGQFEIVGQVYGTAPYGIAVPKDSAHAGLAEAISLALADLASKGTYQQILQKWGVQAGAVTTFGLNGATS
ncbi:MAG: polar amino acid transport system substrate-binding protein [Frankiaceae bacterium]|nr:polar amino acid transport system substrate-binding protein [Frankiaceae bacterium]